MPKAPWYVVAALATATVSTTQAVAAKLPVRDGEFSRSACQGVPIPADAFGVHTFKSGRQFVTPSAEGQDGYCRIPGLVRNGATYSTAAACDRGGKVQYPAAIYALRLTVLDPLSFVSRGVTYRWCAEYR